MRHVCVSQYGIGNEDMKLQMYAIHDQAVKEFSAPDVARTHGEAERKFRTNVNHENNGNLFLNPEHFSLFHVGSYDTETGKLEALKEPMHVISAVQCKETGKQMRVPGT